MQTANVAMASAGPAAGDSEEKHVRIRPLRKQTAPSSRSGVGKDGEDGGNGEDDDDGG